MAERLGRKETGTPGVGGGGSLWTRVETGRVPISLLSHSRRFGVADYVSSPSDEKKIPGVPRATQI